MTHGAYASAGSDEMTLKSYGMNTEQKTLARFWMRAAMPGGVRLELGDVKLARRMRFKLYNIMKKQERLDEALRDEELIIAIGEVELTIEGTVIVGRPKSENPMIRAINEQLGEFAQSDVALNKEEMDKRARELMLRLQGEDERGVSGHGESESSKYR